MQFLINNFENPIDFLLIYIIIYTEVEKNLKYKRKGTLTMKFKKICTKVEFLEKQEDGNWNESTDIIAGRIAKSKLTGYGVIHSVSYLKCNVEIPDAIVNQYASITEISQ